MGVRGELFSTKVSSEKRTYFFNVKENRLGDAFLNIVESKKGEEAEFERHQIMVYQEEIEAFMRELQKAAAVLQKRRELDGAKARQAPVRRRSPDVPATGAEPAERPARTRRAASDRPALVPTYALDGEWKGPEAMKAAGGKVARISRKDIEARAAKAAQSDPAASAAHPEKPARPRKPAHE